MTQWVVGHLGSDVPMHFTAFHPDYKMLDVPPTPPATLTRARQIAIDNGVHYAYTGNVHDGVGGSTFCNSCGTRVIQRDWYLLGEYRARCDRPLPELRLDRARPVRRPTGQVGRSTPTRRTPSPT